MIPYVAEVRMKIYHSRSICSMRCLLRIETVDSTLLVNIKMVMKVHSCLMVALNDLRVESPG